MSIAKQFVTMTGLQNSILEVNFFWFILLGFQAITQIGVKVKVFGFRFLLYKSKSSKFCRNKSIKYVYIAG